MSNRLEMSKVNSILRLRQQGWSLVRIARELGIHRETVARYVHQGSGTETGTDGSKPTQLHTGFSSQNRVEEPLQTNLMIRRLDTIVRPCYEGTINQGHLSK